MISTVPSFSSVAVCLYRALLRLPFKAKPAVTVKEVELLIASDVA